MNTPRSCAFGAIRTVVVLFAVTLLAACAASPIVPPAARSELAPTGKLRVGLLVTNPVYVTKDGGPGEIEGIAVDLGRELAKQLGVSFEPIRYRVLAKLLEGVKGDWDVAFIGYDPTRKELVDFTATYLETGNTYLVPVGSSLRTIADVDRPGHRIAVAPRSVQDVFLTRNLKRAEVVRSNLTEAFALLSAGKAHAYLGNKVTLGGWVAKKPEFRLLDGSVFSVQQALAVAKGRPAGTAYAKQFIEYAKASGLVQQAIERSRLQGLSVAAASAY